MKHLYAGTAALLALIAASSVNATILPLELPRCVCVISPCPCDQPISGAKRPDLDSYSKWLLRDPLRASPTERKKIFDIIDID